MNGLAINKQCGKLKDWCFKMPKIHIATVTKTGNKHDETNNFVSEPEMSGL